VGTLLPDGNRQLLSKIMLGFSAGRNHGPKSIISAVGNKKNRESDEQHGGKIEVKNKGAEGTIVTTDLKGDANVMET
jgi:hypothetical protein